MPELTQRQRQPDHLRARLRDGNQRPERARADGVERAQGSCAMTTAFVLSGGGSLGAVQVGMLRALTE
jgi:predicted acylesterase/phospholipase RssA